MSTRAAIGRVAGDTFEGRYHHSDGYPTGLGRLFTERAAQAADLDAFLAYIVDEHRAGWSYLDDGAEGDRCYCHWTGREEPNDGEPIRDCDLFIEWAYAINPATRTMGVWTSVSDPSRNIAHERGYVEPGYRGQLIAIISIDDAIDWRAIEARGDAAKDAAHAAEGVHA